MAAAITRCTRTAAWPEAVEASLVICGALLLQPLSAEAAASRVLPLFDFLLPSFMSRPSPSRAAALAVFRAQSSHRPFGLSACKSPVVPARMPAGLPPLHRRCHKPHAGIATPSKARLFSTSQRRRQTHTVWHPQSDESGKEMRLEITARAAKRLSQVMEKDKNPRLALRIQVESGGCHGFQYLMSLVTLPNSLPSPDSKESESSVIREDDTIFAYSDENSTLDAADALSAAKIILDTPSLELLNGSKVDFTKELIGSQFKIVDNPLATSSCGCGTSFDIKI